ncbi:hypothetical protein SAMN04488540_11489 [Ferrimonas sediminum]|uniref:TolB-like 6-blade propeller-like n=1 Tax=Ferrimonas sediminum TaxID=718193 RepID=A0A1G8X5R9_9GAMM|nr:hypothetical protein [Ferrimonas sediminum]SDJ85676.1 hypothetical protein SAMN04488540_11489 [Ferrimonas sediminum]
MVDYKWLLLFTLFAVISCSSDGDSQGGPDQSPDEIVTVPPEDYLAVELIATDEVLLDGPERFFSNFGNRTAISNGNTIYLVSVNDDGYIKSVDTHYDFNAANLVALDDTVLSVKSSGTVKLLRLENGNFEQLYETSHSLVMRPGIAKLNECTILAMGAEPNGGLSSIIKTICKKENDYIEKVVYGSDGYIHNILASPDGYLFLFETNNDTKMVTVLDSNFNVLSSLSNSDGDWLFTDVEVADNVLYFSAFRSVVSVGFTEGVLSEPRVIHSFVPQHQLNGTNLITSTGSILIAASGENVYFYKVVDGAIESKYSADLPYTVEGVHVRDKILYVSYVPPYDDSQFRGLEIFDLSNVDF